METWRLSADLLHQMLSVSTFGKKAPAETAGEEIAARVSALSGLRARTEVETFGFRYVVTLAIEIASTVLKCTPCVSAEGALIGLIFESQDGSVDVSLDGEWILAVSRTGLVYLLCERPTRRCFSYAGTQWSSLSQPTYLAGSEENPTLLAGGRVRSGDESEPPELSTIITRMYTLGTKLPATRNHRFTGDPSMRGTMKISEG